MGVKRVFPLGDGRWSSGSPVPAPQPRDAPSSPTIMCGERVWFHACGEWCEGVVRGWECEGSRVLIAPFPAKGERVLRVPSHRVQCEQPRDCGAMIPPQGFAGQVHWLERDHRVFCNGNGAGAAVARPRILWE